MMFNRHDLKSIFIALPAVLMFANGALAAERPANPADWPALKDVYKGYFLIGNTNLNASNFDANVVPGENSVAAMTLKHFNAVTPDNAMKPASLWSAGVDNPTPSFLTNTTTGINNDVRAANARGFKVTGHTLLWHNQSNQWPAANVATPGGGFETPWDYAAAKTNLEYYIRTVAGHFEREPFNVYSWDVVNEAFKDSPDNPADWRNSLRTGSNGKGGAHGGGRTHDTGSHHGVLSSHCCRSVPASTRSSVGELAPIADNAIGTFAPGTAFGCSRKLPSAS